VACLPAWRSVPFRTTSPSIVDSQSEHRSLLQAWSTIHRIDQSDDRSSILSPGLEYSAIHLIGDQSDRSLLQAWRTPLSFAKTTAGASINVAFIVHTKMSLKRTSWWSIHNKPICQNRQVFIFVAV